MLAQNDPCHSPIFRKKKARTIPDSLKAFVRTARHPRLTRPIRNGWRNPPRREKRMRLRRFQIDRQIAKLHRFIALLHSAPVSRFVPPKPYVPITKNRKDRKRKGKPNHIT